MKRSVFVNPNALPMFFSVMIDCDIVGKLWELFFVETRKRHYRAEDKAR